MIRKWLTPTGLAVAVATLFLSMYLTDKWAERRDDKKRQAVAIQRDSNAVLDATAAEAALTSDSVVTVYRDRWRTLETRVDTLRIPVEAREALRSCAAAVTALETSCAAKQALIDGLRRELVLTRELANPRRKRFVPYVEAAYDFVGERVAARAGFSARVVGGFSVEAVADVAPAADDRTKAETRLLLGARLSF